MNSFILFYADLSIFYLFLWTIKYLKIINVYKPESTKLTYTHGTRPAQSYYLFVVINVLAGSCNRCFHVFGLCQADERGQSVTKRWRTLFIFRMNYDYRNNIRNCLNDLAKWIRKTATANRNSIQRSGNQLQVLRSFH